MKCSDVLVAVASISPFLNLKYLVWVPERTYLTTPSHYENDIARLSLCFERKSLSPLVVRSHHRLINNFVCFADHIYHHHHSGRREESHAALRRTVKFHQSESFLYLLSLHSPSASFPRTPILLWRCKKQTYWINVIVRRMPTITFWGTINGHFRH